MAIALSDMRAQIRSELGVSETNLPDALILDYVNLVQIEVAQMLGPVAAPSLRKRSGALYGASSEFKSSVDTGGIYTESGSTLNNFSGLTVNYYAGDEVVICDVTGFFAYKDIVVSNTATAVVTAGNHESGDLTNVKAVILHNPKAIDPGTLGIDLPSDCMIPLYLSTSATPSSETRLDIIQLDDTEQYLQNEYWDAESVAAIHVGDVAHVLKGSSASFASTIVVTYIRRPNNFSSSTDQLKISAGRLPEEYWGIMRAGILKMAAMHLKRLDTAAIQGDDMASRVAAIQRSFGMSDTVRQEEKTTQ